MLEKVKEFIKNEDGYTAESLSWNVVMGLGATAVVFGLLGAVRYLSGGMIDDIKMVQTPSLMPTASETIDTINAGYTGGITSIEVTQ